MAPLFVNLFFAASILSIFFLDTTAAIRITGATGGVNLSSGERPLRQEINTFATSGAAYDLFVLALLKLQSTSQNNPLSYFQIAGIHGLPQIPWDGVGGTGPGVGFCTHNSVLFPTWHRPYLALYEQAIWKNAQDIAQTYPTTLQDEYVSAARTMRIPYWDWVIYSRLPDAASKPIVIINTPTGEGTFRNPLYSYKFIGMHASQKFPSNYPLANMTETVRWYNSTLAPQGNQSAVDTALSDAAPNTLSHTYQALASVTDYSAFACTKAGLVSALHYSIEDVHNNIHNCVGGTGTRQGHMTFLGLSAFDPIFWLHHANLDRLFAMWQALNPTNFVVPMYNEFGTYYQPNYIFESANSSLAPFHSDNGTSMYTSETARSTRTFGYTYPELIDWDVDAETLASNVRTAINTLYNPAASGSHNNSTTASINNNTIINFARSLAAKPHSLATAFHNLPFTRHHRHKLNNLPYTWTITIRHQRFAHPNPFTLEFYMGPPPPLNCSSAAPNLIGRHATFTPPHIPSEMFLPGAPSGLIQGLVSLSHVLSAGVERGALVDLSPRSVVPVLTGLLTWRARGVGGEEVDLRDIRDLEVSVASRVVMPSTRRDEFPRYGRVRVWKGVTRGKSGSVSRGGETRG